MKQKFGQAFLEVKNINSNIKKLTQKKIFQILISKFSLIFKIPEHIIENEARQIISRNFDYKNKKILKFTSFKNFFKNLFLILSLSILFILTFFLRKKIIKKKRVELIIDGALKYSEAFHFNELTKNFKKVGFISKKKFLNRKNISYFDHSYFFISTNEYSFLTRLKFLYFVILLFFISALNFKNYYFIFFEIIYKLLKYDYIFKSIISKSYIQSKFYDTSILKNYLFKINGGKITSCTQKNLLEVGLSSFIYTDIFFSIGKNTWHLLKKLDGNCKKIYPVGSLYMESDWFKKKKDLKNIEKTDLLVLGINTVLRHYKLHITDAFDKNYYKFIKWVAVFSQKFPKLSIAIKHHGNFPHDPKESEIIKKTNIKLQVESNSVNGSYANAFQSKVLCSFGSTMIFELLGHNVPGYFIDPSYENQQFFELLPQSKKWRIKNYKEFERKILRVINSKKMEIKNKNLYCLNSNRVSKRIAKFLKNY